MPDMGKRFSHHTNRENPLTPFFALLFLFLLFVMFVRMYVLTECKGKATKALKQGFCALFCCIFMMFFTND